jgi:GTP-binding protein
VLIAQEPGTSNAYSLFTLQNRGSLFIGPQIQVYGGMIIGESSRPQDLVVNPSRGKKLNNIRTHSHDEKLVLTPPRQMSLEAALEFINADELVEVTPKAIRLRKAILDHNERKRIEKKGA